MKLAILITAVVVGGFFTAKLALDFLDVLLDKLEVEEDDPHQ
jgi:hypothetical protein